MTDSEHLQTKLVARMQKYDLEINSRLDDTKYTNDPTAAGNVMLEDDDFR